MSAESVNAGPASAVANSRRASSIGSEQSLSKTLPPAAVSSTVQVSVCVVNYNNRALLNQCIDSVFAQRGDVPIEVLVADNGSTDDSVTWLKRERPEVHLFENANIGFSRANNQLIEHARGPLILLLNNDCVLEHGSIRQLVDLMESDPEIGILGCRIITREGILQPTFWARPLMEFFLPNPVERYQSHLLAFGKNLDKRRQIMKSYATQHGYDRFREVDLICAVCVLIRRGVFETIGLLDEQFFMYCEDADLCLRARAAGWKICYTPAVWARHFVQRKQEKGSIKLLTEAQFSRCYFVRKHYGRPWASLVVLRYFLQLIFSFVSGNLLFLLRRQPIRECLRETIWRWKALAKMTSAL